MNPLADLAAQYRAKLNTPLSIDLDAFEQAQRERAWNATPPAWWPADLQPVQHDKDIAALAEPFEAGYRYGFADGLHFAAELLQAANGEDSK